MLSLGCGRQALRVFHDTDSGLGSNETGGTLASADGSGGATGTSTPSLCSEVPCLASLVVPCAISPSCVQDDESNDVQNVAINRFCYLNGVSQRLTVDNARHTALFEAKQDGKLCYSVKTDVPLDPSTFSLQFFAPNGKQVATGVLGAELDWLSVTCAGSPATQVSQDCLEAGVYSQHCGLGTCTF